MLSADRYYKGEVANGRIGEEWAYHLAHSPHVHKSGCRDRIVTLGRSWGEAISFDYKEREERNERKEKQTFALFALGKGN
jgi:hypothetical protein